VAGIGGDQAYPLAQQLDIEGTLLRAALLAGYGREARPLAGRLAAAAQSGRGRSCLEAGTPIQLTVDAPGPAALRVGLRLGDDLGEKTLDGLMPAASRRTLGGILGSLPAAGHASLGTWLFWTDARQSIFVDLRDPSPADALERLHRVLDRGQRMRLDRIHPSLIGARPWALRVEADESNLIRVHVHWLIGRDASPQRIADALVPGAWSRAMPVLGRLLRRPGASGRWVIVTPLDDASDRGLRIGNSAWSLVPEDEHKHRAVGELMTALGGPRDHAEALWSLCRGAAAPDWRVGRACELKVTADSLRARLFFAPQIQPCPTA
jgi:hypothetical protein